MKKVLIVVLAIVAIVVIAILALPGAYTLEEGIEIGAPQPAVFAIASQPNRWNMLGMMATMGSMPAMPTGQMQLPKEMRDTMPGGMDLGSMMEGMQKIQKTMGSVKIKVKSSAAPGKIVFKIEGGPMDSMEPEMSIERKADRITLVAIRESYTFQGVFSGVKAITAKMASKKLNATNLQNLKRVCEGKK